MSAEASLRVLGSRLVDRALVRHGGAQKVARRAGWMPVGSRVRWAGARTFGEASRGICANAANAIGPGRTWILVVGEHSRLLRAIERQLRRREIPFRTVPSVREMAHRQLPLEGLACIVVAEVETAEITRTAREALGDRRLQDVPLEYAVGLEPERRQFAARDEYEKHPFVSPQLLADPSPYAIYEESLERFEQKCGIRDYLDLYQCLVSIEERGIPGEVCEFGSYRGHSGWLIARTLEQLSSDRRLLMFDTFQSFPEEAAGIDRFWSGTHHVVFEEVQAKLAEMSRASLVAGDFETTVPREAPDQIALAYVDCDSYRAVSHVAREIYEQQLVPGGVMIFEDYGHPALLGCRLAIHEFFDGRHDCLRSYSHFSGLYIVVKLQ